MAFGVLLGQTASGGGGKRVCRFTVGTSTAGWTANDCDYLCDGTADQVEINAAIQALPTGGGEIVILDGTYNITATIAMNKDNTKLSGNGAATILKRMWKGSSSAEGVITINATNGRCCVENLQIDGNKATYSSSNNKGIYLQGTDNIITGNTCNNNDGNGIYLSGSNTTVTGNTCNNNNINGIRLLGGGNNTITGNTFIRGTGQSSDYTSSQYTILLSGANNDYNLIADNNIMGKNYVSEGGTNNTFANNKYR